MTNLACVYYAAKERMATWPVGVVGILIYLWLFWQAHLVGSALLQLFFRRREVLLFWDSAMLVDLTLRKIPFIPLAGSLEERVRQARSVLSRYTKYRSLGGLIGLT